jgi:DNA-binding NarL/FixJ family response regulator
MAASSYVEGLHLAQETAFDLYLLDHHLGDGCGQKLREKLRELHPATPALFFTGTPYAPSEIDKLHHSGDGYILKPSPTAAIITAVADLLNTSKSKGKNLL